MDNPNPATNSNSNNVTSVAHNELARRISAESTVLLQNNNSLLPISASVKNILLVGTEAAAPIVHGGGSGQVYPDYVVSPLNGIRDYLGISPTPAPPNNCSDGHYEVRATDRALMSSSCLVHSVFSTAHSQRTPLANTGRH
jgi:beta-glucosidase-like glycosyl hydrolase